MPCATRIRPHIPCDLSAPRWRCPDGCPTLRCKVPGGSDGSGEANCIASDRPRARPASWERRDSNGMHQECPSLLTQIHKERAHVHQSHTHAHTHTHKLSPSPPLPLSPLPSVLLERWNVGQRLGERQQQCSNSTHDGRQRPQGGRGNRETAATPTFASLAAAALKRTGGNIHRLAAPSRVRCFCQCF